MACSVSCDQAAVLARRAAAAGRCALDVSAESERPWSWRAVFLLHQSACWGRDRALGEGTWITVRCSGGCGCRDGQRAGCWAAVPEAAARAGHGSWYFSAATCRRSGGAAAGALRRVRHQGGGRRGAGGTGQPRSSAARGRTDDGGVAGPVAGVAGVAAGVDQSRVCRACARLPGPVPGRHPAGGAVARRRPGHVHGDYPRRDRAGPAGERRDAAPDPCHPPSGAQRARSAPG